MDRRQTFYCFIPGLVECEKLQKATGLNVDSQWKYIFFPLTCGAIYPTYLFCVSFGDIGHRDVCLFWKIMEQMVFGLSCSKLFKNTFKRT